MRRRNNEAPYSEAEHRFLAAIDRLAQGQPIHGDVKKRKSKITMTTIAREAGYARTYLYKNHLPRVMARIEALLNSPKAVTTSKDLADKLRAERNEALVDRDKAIDAARRWMQRCFRLERDIKELTGKVARLEKREAANDS